MTDTVTSQPFVSDKLIAERPAPIKTTGFVGFLRTRLFNSPTNILITIVSALLLWFIVVPALRFLLVDAVWSGNDRNACLAENGFPFRRTFCTQLFLNDFRQGGPMLDSRVTPRKS